MILGWDDAPEIEIEKALKNKSITLVYPFYCNGGFLVTQVMKWLKFPEELKKNISAIIVDDGSPMMSADQVLVGLPRPFPIRVFRIEVDVRWNWLAARNIGLYHAPAGGWVVATDMDHVIPEETIETLINGSHDEKIIYRFNRIECTGEKIHPHPNSWFMTRSMFWRFGGYDEALSGYYGTDGEARRRLVKTAPVRTMSDHLIRFEHKGDSSTSNYLRKQPMDQRVQEIIKARKQDWRPKVLSFPYHEVEV